MKQMRIIFGSLWVAAIMPFPCAAGDWQFLSDASLSHHDNVGYSYNGVAQSDFILSAGLGARRSDFVGDHGGLELAAHAGIDQYPRFPGLSRLTLRVEGNYRWQPVSGYGEPWLDFRTSAALLQHQDSSIRDGGVFEIGPKLGKRFTDRISAGLGAGLEIRRSEEGTVFDHVHRSLLVSADYRLGEAATVHLGAARVFGDVTTSAVTPSDSAGLAKAFTRDGALSVGRDRSAYRYDAQTNQWDAAVEIPVFQESVVNVGVGYLRSHIKPGDTYYATTLHFGYLCRL